MLPSQEIASFQTESKPECLENQAVSLVSDFHFVYFRGHFISLFRVSVHENALKRCLDFEMNTFFIPLTLEKKVCLHSAKLSVQMHMLQLEHDESCANQSAQG